MLKMPVNLPQKPPTDPRLLTLLGHIAESSGRLCLSEDEYEFLEEESFFQDAARKNLISIDHGGEWSSGAVIAITRQGRLMIGYPEPENIWKRLEVLFRRRTGGADG
ncbi:hypothetical protein [Aliirhizobium smilacinae]|uniref:Uncharacterized protein n=1 Tax=Aliirhizobium smilacinae TaxID=1395944 RepID=A0A5C4XGV9_9HYPH|nr:hypothetical protein [Rhizobium smilacinae]TNM62548.1 hypothetical protein FHP24_15005 [Rhizobium smilacinae]